MRNISPGDAKTTNEVLDRILFIKKSLDSPPNVSIAQLELHILVIKALLVFYQPTPFPAIKEGKRSKGGRNTSPSTPRPAPPKGQGKKNL